MAKIEFKGIEKYQKKIISIDKQLEKSLGAAIYVGADVIADEIRKGIEGLPISQGFGTTDKPLPGGVTKIQKGGLLKGLGIARLQNDNGYVNVKIGFDGYNGMDTSRYPQGQPNQLVARGVESGTSWKQKTPFIRPAIRRASERSEKAMSKELDKEFEKIMD